MEAGNWEMYIQFQQGDEIVCELSALVYVFFLESNQSLHNIDMCGELYSV